MNEHTPDPQPPVEEVECELDQIAIDSYGIKTKFRQGEPEEEEPTVVPKRRPWRDVWQDCEAGLQQLVVTTVMLPVIAVQQLTRIVKNTGRLSKGIADIAQRLAGGRSRVDHSEDEKIAEAAEQPTLPDPNEAQALSDQVVERLKRQIEDFQAQGIPVRFVRNQQGQWVILLVAEVHQPAVLQQIQKQLPRLPETSLNKSPEEVALLQTPISELNLSSRGKKCLHTLNVLTVGDLCQRSAVDLLHVDGFGKSSLDEIRSKLAVLGLSLHGE